MRRIRTALATIALVTGMLGLGSPAAHACVGLRCQVACIKSMVENLGRPVVCPD